MSNIFEELRTRSELLKALELFLAIGQWPGKPDHLQRLYHMRDGKLDEAALLETHKHVMNSTIRTVGREIVSRGLFSRLHEILPEPNADFPVRFAWNLLGRASLAESKSNPAEAKEWAGELVRQISGYQEADGETFRAIGKALRELVIAVTVDEPPADKHTSKEAEKTVASAQQEVQPAIDDEDERILRALQKAAPRLLNQYDLETNSKVSRRTISKRLPQLLRYDLVSQPKGIKSGTIITPAGRTVLDQIDRAKVAQ
jgi:hypothetical protein